MSSITDEIRTLIILRFGAMPANNFAGSRYIRSLPDSFQARFGYAQIGDDNVVIVNGARILFARTQDVMQELSEYILNEKDEL